jgi:acetyl esterase/lipase
VAGLFLAATAFAQSARYESPIFEKVDVKSDVVFHTAKNVKGENEALKLDIYTAAGDTERNRPAIVWFHGGGFRPGNDKKQSYVVAMSKHFAKRGYVCIAPDYRVREEQGRGPDRLPTLKDAVEDGHAALAWVRSHAAELGLDPQRIAVGGGSAGGQLATSLVALENIAAAKNKTAGIFAYVDLWGSPTEDFMLAKVDEHYPPTVIVHGTADRSVPFANSETLVARLKQKGIKHELVAIPDAPHTPTAHMDAFVKTVSAFVAKALPAAKHH